jgi:hypothetical protein
LDVNAWYFLARLVGDQHAIFAERARWRQQQVRVETAEVVQLHVRFRE